MGPLTRNSLRYWCGGYRSAPARQRPLSSSVVVAMPAGRCGGLGRLTARTNVGTRTLAEGGTHPQGNQRRAGARRAALDLLVALALRQGDTRREGDAELEPEEPRCRNHESRRLQMCRAFRLALDLRKLL